MSTRTSKWYIEDRDDFNCDMRRIIAVSYPVYVIYSVYEFTKLEFSASMWCEEILQHHEGMLELKSGYDFQTFHADFFLLPKNDHNRLSEQ